MNKPLTFKLLALALLALVLAFAVNQVEWKVQERHATRDGAVQTIADQYAREQQLVGPLLWVKCSEPRTLVEADGNGGIRQKTVIDDCSRTLRPAQLSGQGNLDVVGTLPGHLQGPRLSGRHQAACPDARLSAQTRPDHRGSASGVRRQRSARHQTHQIDRRRRQRF